MLTPEICSVGLKGSLARILGWPLGGGAAFQVVWLLVLTTLSAHPHFLFGNSAEEPLQVTPLIFHQPKAESQCLQ